MESYTARLDRPWTELSTDVRINPSADKMLSKLIEEKYDCKGYVSFFQYLYKKDESDWRFRSSARARETRVAPNVSSGSASTVAS